MARTKKTEAAAVATEPKKEKKPASYREAVGSEHLKEKLAKRESELIEKYGPGTEHNQSITAGSISYDTDADKISVEITCQHDGETKFRVFTSDLFQVKFSPMNIKVVRRERAKARRAEVREAMAALKAAKGE